MCLLGFVDLIVQFSLNHLLELSIDRQLYGFSGLRGLYHRLSNGTGIIIYFNLFLPFLAVEPEIIGFLNPVLADQIPLLILETRFLCIRILVKFLNFRVADFAYIAKNLPSQGVLWVGTHGNGLDAHPWQLFLVFCDHSLKCLRDIGENRHRTVAFPLVILNHSQDVFCNQIHGFRGIRPIGLNKRG